MMRTLSTWATILLLASGLYGCSESITSTDLSGSSAGTAMHLDLDYPDYDPASPPVLYAGQNIPVGTVTVEILDDEGGEAQTLRVTIATDNGWRMSETHVATAESLERLPQTGSGNPKVGHFDFSGEHDGLTEVVYDIAMDALVWGTDDRLYLAVHAVVFLEEETGIWEETAWAEGGDFPGSSWATYFTYTLESGGEGEITISEPPAGCELCEYFLSFLTWQASGTVGDFVRIDLLYDGEPCMEISASAANGGFFEWEMTERCSGDSEGYQIRVTDLTTGAVGESGVFSIVDCGGE